MVSELQAAVAATQTGPRYIAAFGKQYELRAKLPALPYMEYAELAEQGADSSEMHVAAVSLRMLRGCFTKAAWEQFKTDCDEEGPDGEELFEITNQAIALITARPTQSPSDSSDGQPATTTSSTGPSSFEEYKLSLAPDWKTFNVKDLAS